MASSPSHIALEAAHNGNLRLLKEMGKKVDLRGAKDEDGDTALHFAAIKGCLESCRFLVEESGLDVNVLSKTGVTPMFYAARNGHVQVLRYLLDHGGDPAMPDERGTIPLHNAALKGHREVVRLLLSNGVPVDPVDYRGTPLHLAVSHDQVEVVKVLLEHSADPNKVANQIYSPVLMAYKGRSLKCIKLLVEAGADVNAPGYPAPSPLMQAVQDGLTDFVKLFIEAGADPNIPSQLGVIPLQQAAAQGRRDLVEVLFHLTKPIPSLPDWSVDGIMRTVRINPLQDAVPWEEKIADWKSRAKEAFAKEDYYIAIYFYSLDYEGAADAFREALQLDPKNEEVREALRKAEKAVEELQ